MELSANWKKLKATLSAETPRKQLSKQSDRGTKILKRKRPAALVSRPANKLKIDKSSMENDIAGERVNEGLCER